ncbi:MAG: hypothetical protein ACREVK_13000 [Gammaproteobacteria bacterium]
MKSNNAYKAIAFIILSLCAVGCETSRFSSTWKSPDAQPVHLSGQKVLAVCLSASDARRLEAEDILARELTERGAQGVASHTLFPAEQVKEVQTVKARLLREGFDGVVTMRVIGQQERVTYTPGAWTGPYYGGFRGYWGYGWGAVYEPGYLSTDTIVSVETLIYSIKQDKLLWAGVSETTDPSKVDAFISELADAVGNEMKKAGLLI